MNGPADTDNDVHHTLRDHETRIERLEQAMGIDLDRWITLTQAVEITGRSESWLRRRNLVHKGRVRRETAEQHRRTRP